MARALVLSFFLALVVFVAATAQEEQCPENQEWTTCGSACPPACNSKPNQPCTLQCFIGCQCKQGYLKNSEEQCVPPDQC